MGGRANGQWSVGDARGPPTDSSDMASLTFPFLPAPPSSPLTPHCLQSIGPGLLDRSIALYRAVAVCPSSNHRGPSSCRPMQGSASSRPFSLRSIFFSPHRLPPRQSGTAWPGLSAGLLLGPSSSVPMSPSSLLLPSVYGLAPTGCGTDIARFFWRKQGSSSFLATPLL